MARQGEQPHAKGEACAVRDRLCRVHVAEIAVAIDGLTVRQQRALAKAAGVPAEIRRLAPRLASRLGELDPNEGHKVARHLLLAVTASAHQAMDDPVLDVREVVARLAGEWPPGIVVSFVELAWEASGLPTESLDRQALSRLEDLEPI